MIKIFAPPLDTMWRLTEDWTPPAHFLERDDNRETLHAEVAYQFDAFTQATGISTGGVGATWVEPYHEWLKQKRDERGVPLFLSGTVLVIDRYHASHSGTEVLTLRVLASPEPKLTAKKLGGQMKGKGRLYFTLNDINTLPPVEEVESLA